jgi:uncharacterized protein
LKSIKTIGIALAAMIVAGGPALAQTVGLGSTTRGGTSQIGKSISAVVSEVSKLQMRPQEMANTADYMPLVNAGQIEFGIANQVQTWFAYNGTGMSAGKPMKNLRIASVLMPFRAGWIVPNSSGITSMKGMKGKRMPLFKDGTLGDHVLKAFLANAGMTYDDVVPVPVPNFPRMWNSFKQGTTDGTLVVVGSKTNREMDATVKGGIRFISFDAGKLDVMHKWMPGMELFPAMPSPKLPGVVEKTNVMMYDYLFFANDKTSDDQVYEAVKALYNSEKKLLASGPFWKGFTGKRMANKSGMPFHPGAIKFYKEMGIWKD